MTRTGLPAPAPTSSYRAGCRAAPRQRRPDACPRERQDSEVSDWATDPENAVQSEQANRPAAPPAAVTADRPRTTSAVAAGDESQAVRFSGSEERSDPDHPPSQWVQCIAQAMPGRTSTRGVRSLALPAGFGRSARCRSSSSQPRLEASTLTRPRSLTSTIATATPSSIAAL